MEQNQEEHYIPKTLEECLKMDENGEPCLVETEGIVRGALYCEDNQKIFYGYLQQNDSLVKFYIIPGPIFTNPLASLLNASSEGNIAINVKGKYDPLEAELKIHSLNFGVYDYSGGMFRK